MRTIKPAVAVMILGTTLVVPGLAQAKQGLSADQAMSNLAKASKAYLRTAEGRGLGNLLRRTFTIQSDARAMSRAVTQARMVLRSHEPRTRSEWAIKQILAEPLLRGASPGSIYLRTAAHMINYARSDDAPDLDRLWGNRSQLDWRTFEARTGALFAALHLRAADAVMDVGPIKGRKAPADLRPPASPER